jgi:hypothetical protein
VICIGCGCDESQACTLPGGKACAWVHVGILKVAGICSACVELFPPSSIAKNLRTCEAAIVEAELAGVEGIENAFVGNRERILEGLAARESHHALYGDAKPGDPTPAGIFSTPDALDDPREGHPAFSFEEVSPLILPGDEEFHL